MQAFYGSWKEHLEKADESSDASAVMPWLFSKAFRSQHPDKVSEIKTRLTGNYLSRNSEAFERQMKANIEHKTKGRLHQVDVPTLIIVGKQDELTPPKMAKELESEMPRARLQVLEEGGHGLYWEAPHLFNKAVLDFFNSH